MNRISIPDTHVYPGCLAVFHFRVIPGISPVPALAGFSDGITACAEVEPLSTEEVIVRIEGYTTARNTRIAEKTWRLAYQSDTDLWKVVAKM